MKDKKTIWIILAILVVGLFLFSNVSKKEASVTATRTFSSNKVSPGGTVTVTYHPSVMNYISIIENLPDGWTSNKPITVADGKIRTIADGSDVVIIFTAPSSIGTHTFSGGQYNVYPDTDWTTFTSKTITVESGGCTDTSWTPSPSTVCDGESFTQTSNCGTTKDSTGTKDCSSPCTDIAWTPSPSTVCSGESFEQTSNCGTTKDNTGTKDCNGNGGTETCEERLDCEMWEQCNDDGDECEMAGWVWLIGAFMGLMFMMSAMK